MAGLSGRSFAFARTMPATVQLIGASCSRHMFLPLTACPNVVRIPNYVRREDRYASRPARGDARPDHRRGVEARPTGRARRPVAPRSRARSGDEGAVAVHLL